jgi:hypothetical protein
MKRNVLLVTALLVALFLMTGLIGGCGGQEQEQAVTGKSVKEQGKEAVETTITYSADDSETSAGSSQRGGTDRASINRAQPSSPTGACCLPNLSCTQTTAEACEAAGGGYQGDGTNCTSVQCDI